MKQEKEPSLDQQLLEKSGIRTSGRVAMRFIEDSLSATLMYLEDKHVKKLGRTIQDAEQTIFQVKPHGEYWKIEVTEMRFRRGEN